MNICSLNVSSKMCAKFAPACITLIAAERINHFAIARPYNEANTVGFDQSGT